ncbi:MAG: hypothetical protein ACXWFB_06835 [Nitrososphaeraceae archaeon]
MLIWNIIENESGYVWRPLDLKNWLNTTAIIVEGYRNHGIQAEVLSVI